MLQILIEAIQVRKPITFDYKTEGTRVGNVHAVFIMAKKDGSRSTKVHIAQTGGVSTSGKAFPSFRMFDLHEIADCVILHDQEEFLDHPEYNALSEIYGNVIAKL